MSDITHRLKQGFGWGVIGSIGWRLLSAVGGILVARILGPTGFGELGLVRGTANMFSVYACFRLGATASKHVAQYRLSAPARAARILKFSLVMAGVFCFLTALGLLAGAPYLACETLKNETLVLPLRLCSVFLFFQSYSAVKESVLLGTENFKAFAKINIVKGVLSVCFIVPGAYWWGVSGAIAGLGLAAIGSYVALCFYVKQSLSTFGIRKNIPFSEWRRELPLLWTYALPGMLGGMLMVTTIWVGKILLAGSEDGYSQLGLFEVANQWRTAVLFLPGILSRIAMPILAETHQRDGEHDFNKAVGLQFNIIMAITLPLTVSVILFSPILIMVSGEAYGEAQNIMPVLMGSVFFFSLNQSLRQVQDGTGRRWQNFGINFVWAVSFWLVSMMLVRTYGAKGLVYAYFIAEILMFLIQVVYVDFIISRHALMPIARPLLLALIVVFFTMFMDNFCAGYWLILASAFLALSSLLPLWILLWEKQQLSSI